MRPAPRPQQPPVFLKVAPDLEEAEIEAIAARAAAWRIDGLVVSNTTIERPAASGGRTRLRSGASPARRCSPAQRGAGAFARASARPGGAGRRRRSRERRGGLRQDPRRRAGGAALHRARSIAGQGWWGIKRDLAAALRRDGLASVADAVGLDA